MDTWLAKFKKQDEQAAVALVAHEQPLQAPVEQELTTPKKKGYKLPWLPGRKWLAIVFMVLSVASMAIGLGVGLGLGMKNTTHDTSQVRMEDKEVVCRLLAATGRLAAHTPARARAQAWV